VPDTVAAPAALRVAAADGFGLAATWYESAASAPPGRQGGLVLVVPATGVRRRLYDPLATFLAAQGFDVLTWDWRGTGESRPHTLRGFRATMTDWATLDLGGVLAWAARRTDGGRLLAIGHSFGGQVLGFTSGEAAEAAGLAGDRGAPVAAAVTVAAQSGYWRLWPRPRRYSLALLWYVGMPALTTLCGFFPSSRLGLGEDLPAGVARQWARWCRSPRYLGDYGGHARFTAPILALSFADDTFASRRAVEALHREYRAAPVEHRHLSPGELGVRSVGHFGLFKPGVPALWQAMAGWLRHPGSG
jgi:predicted alpha/beta hydrolase